MSNRPIIRVTTRNDGHYDVTQLTIMNDIIDGVPCGQHLNLSDGRTDQGIGIDLEDVTQIKLIL